MSGPLIVQWVDEGDLAADLVLRWRMRPPMMQPVATIIGPRGPAGILFAEDIGDGVSTSIPVAHNLGTKDLAVNIYATNGSQPDIIADVYRIDADTIRLDFAVPPALGEFRVVLIGVAA